MFPSYRGGALSRAGTALVGRCKQSDLANPPRLIPFTFSINQTYALEFGQDYMRVITEGAYVLNSFIAITGATQANPCVISAVNSYSNGDWVYIKDVNGMTELNGQTFIVAGVSGTTFQLHDLDGNAVNSTGFIAYAGGGQVARIFTLVTPYAAADLPALKYAQSADVMSLTHPNYAPQELSRIAADNWTIAAANFAADIGPPANLSLVATVNPSGATTPPTKPTSYGYSVTAVDAMTGQESIGCPMAVVTNSIDMGVTAGSIIASWDAVSGAGYYNVYRTTPNYNTNTGSATDANPPPAGSLTGYLGTTYSTQFVDSNITPDFSKVPPIHKNPFAPGQVLSVNITNGGAAYTTSATVAITTGTGAGFTGVVVVVGGVISAVVVTDAGHDYLNSDTVVFTDGAGGGATATLTIGPASGVNPSCVNYFQERRVYASSLNNPDTLWFSQPGQFLDFDSRIPTLADDAITVTPFGTRVDGIQILGPMPGGRVVLTRQGAWQILGPGSFGTSNVQPITPSSIEAVPQAYNGIHDNIAPIVINYDILYVQSRGSIVRDLAYNFFANIYTGTDLTILSSHLFQDYNIRDWTYAEEPFKIVWACREEDGTLLSLTYLKEQEVLAWARHDTQGQVKSVCAVSEPPVNALYTIVERPYKTTAIFVAERMDNRLWQTAEDPWCVDSAVSLPMPTPAAALFASSATGTGVSFQATAHVFSAGDVGSILRMGGGIAKVTGFISQGEVVGDWLFPCQQTVPNDPTATPMGQGGGQWSLTKPVMKVSGLNHLIGRQVVGLADGVPIGPFTVAVDGAVALPFAASNIKMGLAFTSQLQSVYLDAGEPTIQGRRKSIYATTVRVAQSTGFQVGSNQTDGSTLSPPVINPVWSGLATASNQGTSYTSAAGQTVQVPFTGDVRVNVSSAWRKPGQVAVQQTQPLPLNILAFVPECLIGDSPDVQVQPEKEKRQSR